MKKYLVDIYLPAIGIHYDVYLPAGKKVSETVGLLAKIMETLSGGSFLSGSDSVLINADDGNPVNYDISVYDAGIRNASNLILI
jgi:hypothetical protein